MAANQRHISVNKNPCSHLNKEQYYAKIQLAGLDAAAANLSAPAFKLWIYFAKNEPNYQFDLNSQYLADHFGMSKKQYRPAFDELEAKGYLVVKPGTKTKYFFYETPKETESNFSKETKSNFCEGEENLKDTKSNFSKETDGNFKKTPTVIRNIINTTEQYNCSENLRTSCENFPHAANELATAESNEEKGDNGSPQESTGGMLTMAKVKELWLKLQQEQDAEKQRAGHEMESAYHQQHQKFPPTIALTEEELENIPVEEIERSLPTAYPSMRIYTRDSGEVVYFQLLN